MKSKKQKLYENSTKLRNAASKNVPPFLKTKLRAYISLESPDTWYSFRQSEREGKTTLVYVKHPNNCKKSTDLFNLKRTYFGTNALKTNFPRS